MKKLFCIIVLFPLLAMAQDQQELDSAVVDTAEVVLPPYYLGVYLDAAISNEPSAPNRNFMRELGLGVQYERWVITFSRHDFLGVFENYVVFPNVFEMNYRYGGIAVAYNLYRKEWVGLMAKVGYYKGDMVWKNSNEVDFLRDTFSLVRGDIQLEMGKLRYVRPYLSLGYQKMQDLKLSSVSNADFSGIYAKVGLRVGFFNQ